MDSFLAVTLFAASLNVEVQPALDAEKQAEIVAWIEATADTLKLAYGRFPNPDVRIVVRPSSENAWGSDSAVIFGRVTRKRGETVELWVNPDRPIEEFYADWTATHEFSHLMLPLLAKRDRWVSEGFASYYQNILMSRAARYTPEFAWQRLVEGFARGRDSRPDLSPNEAAAAGIRHARMKVYWSGAAIALMADIELRERSGGAQSLDSVLGQLQECCLPASQQWSAPRLFRQLDEFLEDPLFSPLYRRFADQPGFPEVARLLQELGVELNADGTVSLDDERPLADIRQAISKPR